MTEFDFGRYAHQGLGPGPPALTILPTDRRVGRRAAGDPGGPCSRCGVPLGGEMPVWAFAGDGSFAYRFHPRCLGFEADVELGEAGDIP